MTELLGICPVCEGWFITSPPRWTVAGSANQLFCDDCTVAMDPGPCILCGRSALAGSPLCFVCDWDAHVADEALAWPEAWPGWGDP